MKLKEYLRAINGQELSDFELLDVDHTLPQLSFSIIKTTEAEKVVSACEELQAALPNLDEDQKFVFVFVIVEAV